MTDAARALRELTEVTSNARKALSNLTSITARLAAHSIPVVAGVWAGSTSILAAYFATVQYPSLDLAVLGTLAAMVGTATGVLLARIFRCGSDAALLENFVQSMELNREAARQLTDEIFLLPKGTPKPIKDRKYDLLAELDHNYVSMVGLGVLPNKTKPSSKQHSITGSNG